MWTFTCSECAYTSSDAYTVEVISDIEGACPECGAEIFPDMFSRLPAPSDPATTYGFLRTTSPAGIQCVHCGVTFPVPEGSVMRGHARRCPVLPRDFPIPARCDS